MDQVHFLKKLARGELPVKPEAAVLVQGLTTDQTRGAVALSSLGANCPSTTDDSRSVSWWVGRIKGPASDRVFALSIESDHPLPGAEIRSRTLPILTDAGLLPRS